MKKRKKSGNGGGSKREKVEDTSVGESGLMWMSGENSCPSGLVQEEGEKAKNSIATRDSASEKNIPFPSKGVMATPEKGMRKSAPI